MKLHVGGDEGSRKFRICCCSCTTASDIVRDIVDLRWSVYERTVRCTKSEGVCTFSQFLSATMGPSVARVSAPKMMPSLKRHPTIVVPVLVALGNGMPRSVRKLFLQPHGQARSCSCPLFTHLTSFVKSKPGPE